MKTDIIERIIGYNFKNKRLLERAFTHSSYANEHTALSNEQFEFLGDGLLGFVVAEKLFGCGLLEGDMTVKRAEIVSTPPLCRIMDSFKLTEHICFGQGEAGKDHTGKKVLADIFESMVAAVYLDGGFDAAKKVILGLLSEEMSAVITGKKEASNHKGELQEYVQKYKLGRIEYRQSGISGDDHEPDFKAEVAIGGEVFGEGRGKKLKDAEQQAAKAALEKIMNR